MTGSSIVIISASAIAGIAGSNLHCESNECFIGALIMFGGMFLIAWIITSIISRFDG